MPRSAARCGIGVRPLRSRSRDDSAFSITAPVAKIEREIGEALHARGDVHRLPEIVLPLVQHDGEARPLVDADLEQQVLAPVLVVERRIASRMRSAAATARSGVGKVAITASPMVLTTAPASAATISLQHPEMRPHQVEGDEVADPLVELGRAAADR